MGSSTHFKPGLRTPRNPCSCLQTLPCLGAVKGQDVCHRKGAGLAGGWTSDLPWPPQDTLYFATMTAGAGGGVCRACQADSTREDVWDGGRETCVLVLHSEPGLLLRHEQRRGEAVCEVSSPWTRGNAKRGTWKLQYDSVLKQQVWGTLLEQADGEVDPEETKDMGAWPRVRGWTRTGGKRRLSLWGPSAHTEKPRRGQLGPKQAGCLVPRGTAPIGPGGLSFLKGRLQTFLVYVQAHSDLKPVPGQPLSFVSYSICPCPVSPDLIKADSSISPSHPAALSPPQARFTWRSGPGASQPA